MLTIMLSVRIVVQMKANCRGSNQEKIEIPFNAESDLIPLLKG